MDREYDVLVAGAGPAGCAAAIVLSRAGVRVLLLERARAPGFRIGEALPPAAVPLLRDLGIWERFVSEPHLPSFGNVSCWGTSLPDSRDFIFDTNGHGWHLDRARFDSFLRSEAIRAGASLLTDSAFPAAASGIARGWTIYAAGRQSPAPARRIFDDRLVAIFQVFQTDAADRDSRTSIEAAEDGWWYTALLPSSRRIVAYITDADMLPRSPERHSNWFGQLLANAPLTSASLRHSNPATTRPEVAIAHSGRLARFAGDDWLAVGDAAMTFDPLSSQGILNALYTGMKGGEAVLDQLGDKAGAVHRYESNLETIYATYRRNLASYYAMEQRWPQSRFWSVRHGHVSHEASSRL